MPSRRSSPRRSPTKHAILTKRMYAKAKKLSGKKAKSQTIFGLASKLAAGKSVKRRKSSKRSSRKSSKRSSRM